MESVQFIEDIKSELNRIIADSAVDKLKKEKLSKPTTDFYLHKNLM